MNFVFISPNFPNIYSHFVKSLKNEGVNVLGIGDSPFELLNDELKDNLTEYCYVSDMTRLDWMSNTLQYLKWKYGEIDFLESNNEFWLENDAKLREILDIKNGQRPQDMEKIKYKSKMKEHFIKAGAKVARYILADDISKSLEFVKQVGYPIFAKPDNGVGAASTYKINNEQELIEFHQSLKEVPYIIEEYLDGYIISFDGICNDNSEVIFAVKETFPTPIDQIVKTHSDYLNYATHNMDDEFAQLGRNVVKSFGIKKRCFHIEFFVLKEDKSGLANKGDVIALEVNMRSPGGHTPDLISMAIGQSYYDVYAQVIKNNECHLEFKKDIYAAAVSRFLDKKYAISGDEILNRYQENIIHHGFYPQFIKEVMGDEYFFGQFKSQEEAEIFAQEIQKRSE